METDLKTPPNNTEAERAVLGSILMDTAAGDDDRVMDLCLRPQGTRLAVFAIYLRR